MKAIINVLLFVYCTSFTCQSQNLIPNGDFEEYTSLPDYATQWNRCVAWTNAGGTATPDYYHINGSDIAQLPNPFNGTVHPYSGNAIMGLVAYSSEGGTYREYISVKLIEPMVVGETYHLSFYMTNGEITSQPLSSNHNGIRLTVDPCVQMSTWPIINNVPQLEIPGEVWETTWKEFTFDFVADQAYNYITFGNFYDNPSTSITSHNPNSGGQKSYYYYDKMELTQTSGNSNNTTNGGNGGSNSNSGNTVDPITPDFSGTDLLQLPNVFTPNNDGVNEVFVPILMEGISKASIIILNRWGQTVYQSDDLTVGWDGKEYSAGVYYWRIDYFDLNNTAKSRNGFLTLLR